MALVEPATEVAALNRLAALRSHPPAPLAVVTIVITQPQLPVGGRLLHFGKIWRERVTDRFVLQTVTRGPSILFHRKPPLLPSPPESTPARHRTAMREQVASLLQKRAICKAPLPSLGFYTRLFLVPKKTGGYRPVINLKPLNLFIVKEHFKMETQRSIRKALRKGEWAVIIDARDAFFHIAIKKAFQKYLRFCSDGEVYQFQALPFGLSTSPSIFTRVAAQLGVLIHKLAILLHMYLDDWLCRAPDPTTCLHHAQRVVSMASEMGFIINEKKSELVPTQQFCFLGEDVDLAEGTVKPTEQKVDKVLAFCRLFRKHRLQEARTILSFLGLLSAIADVVHLGRLHARPIQLYLLSNWKMSEQPVTTEIALNRLFLDHLEWWTDRGRLRSGVSLEEPSTSCVLATDSSLTGWGATLDAAHPVHGTWPADFQDNSINWLELKTVHLAVVDQLQDKVVLLLSDNTTTVQYIRKQGGTHSPALCYLSWQILKFCETHRITLVARHIAGKLNTMTDQLSRLKEPNNTEWSLNTTIF